MISAAACRSLRIPNQSSSPLVAPITPASEADIVSYFRHRYRFHPPTFNATLATGFLKRSEGDVFFLSVSDYSGVPACEFVLYYRYGNKKWMKVIELNVAGTRRITARWSLMEETLVETFGDKGQRLQEFRLPMSIRSQ